MSFLIKSHLKHTEVKKSKAKKFAVFLFRVKCAINATSTFTLCRKQIALTFWLSSLCATRPSPADIELSNSISPSTVRTWQRWGCGRIYNSNGNRSIWLRKKGVPFVESYKFLNFVCKLVNNGGFIVGPSVYQPSTLCLTKQLKFMYTPFSFW